MAENEKKGERFGEEPKIKPRQVTKSDKEGDEGAEERKRRHLLEKKSDGEWLSKLKPLEKKSRDDQTRESDQTKGSPEKDASDFLDEKKPSSDSSRCGKPVAEDSAEPSWEDDEKDPIEEQDFTSAEPEEEDEPRKSGDSGSSRRRRRRSHKKSLFPLSFKAVLPWLKTKALMLGGLIIGVCVFAAVFWKIGEADGYRAGRKMSLREVEIEESKKVYALPPEASQQLDSALLRLREADSSSTEEIARMVRTYPDIPTLNYAASLASIQSGDLDNATKFAETSIARNERVSDSFVILSIVESQKAAENPGQQFGDPRLRVKKILEKAIAADPMNSGARMEMGSLLRYMGDEPGAIRELRSAKARLHPVDSHLSVDVTVALIEVENLPLDALTPSDPNTDDVRVIFPAAYIAMRHDNFPLGISLLKRCKNMLSPDTFNYLVNDRAFRRFSYLPEMKELQGR
jgi:hypothetical protein